MQVTLRPTEHGIFEHLPPECQENLKGVLRMCNSTRPANCSSCWELLMSVCVHPKRELVHSQTETHSIEALGASDIELLPLWIISFGSEWPILVVPSSSDLSLLFSRVIEVVLILYAILSVASSTLSNLLVGSFSLVDSLLILLYLDRVCGEYILVLLQGLFSVHSRR